MALSHGSATRTALCNAAVDRIDLGSGTATGYLRFLSAADATICNITLANPAFAAASGPSAALLGVPLVGSVTASGTITKFRFLDRDAATIIEGTVGLSGADINLTSVTPGIGDSIQIDGITYTATT
jgi:hypothetical protein